MVKPEKARALEDMILRMAQTGQLKEKLTDVRLQAMLSDLEAQQSKASKVTVSRAPRSSPPLPLHAAPRSAGSPSDAADAHSFACVLAALQIQRKGRKGKGSDDDDDWEI